MHNTETSSIWSRRQFLGGTLAAAAASSFGVLTTRGAETAAPAAPAEFKRKIKLGVVGNGGRGGWLAGLFQKHGGYEMHAVADYFQEVADQCGNALGVDKSRRFSTLSGYKRLLESGVEAVVLEVPPYFFPEQARAAVEAGLHVYMAKPVAVDVPGCLQIQAASRQATKKQRCFYVDYQMPTDPINREVRQQIHAASFAKIMHVATAGIGGGRSDPPKTKTLESRLRNLIWVNDIAMGGDLIVNFDIHAIDTAIWALGKHPVAAAGGSSFGRADPQGDSRDVCSVVFEYADGLVHNHFGQSLKNQVQGELCCRIYSQSGFAIMNYWGKSKLRSSEDGYSGEVENLYDAGAMRNIAEFYQRITKGRFENEIGQRAVDGALTCILGREAAARHIRLNLDELLKENRKLEVDLTGLKT